MSRKKQGPGFEVMKIEQRINGSVQLILTPENDIERAVLSAMHNSTKVGRKIAMVVNEQAAGVTQATFTVEAQ